MAIKFELFARRATTNTPAARALARSISDPWYRCQALAWVAYFAPKAQFKAIAQESLAAGNAADDPYQVIGATAWPLAALVERVHNNEVHHLLPSLLTRAASIANPVSRIDALFLLWQAVFPLGIKIHRQVLDPLVEACREADSWKGPDRLCQVTLMLALTSPLEAEQIVTSMPDGRHKRQVTRRIAAGQYQSPRKFFWHV